MRDDKLRELVDDALLVEPVGAEGVERVARAISVADPLGNDDWDTSTEGYQQDYRQMARAALRAMGYEVSDE